MKWRVDCVEYEQCLLLHTVLFSNSIPVVTILFFFIYFFVLYKLKIRILENNTCLFPNIVFLLILDKVHQSKTKIQFLNCECVY